MKIFLFSKSSKPHSEISPRSTKSLITFDGIDVTEKLQTHLKRWNIEDFKNVHHFTVALFCQKLLASKVESKI